jgi:primosomal protein N' (replication factor Y)
MHVARVVVDVEPFHLDRPFDYLIGDDLDDPVAVGTRVEVVFAGRRRLGLVVEVADGSDVPPDKLRPLRRTLGAHAWATPDELEVFAWAAERFGAPVADVVRHALPKRTVAVERAAQDQGWYRTRHDPDPRAPGDRPDLDVWETYGAHSMLDAVHSGHGAFVWRPLADEDVGCRLAELAALCLAGGRDVLCVVPDPSSRVADRLVADLDEPLVDVRGVSSPRAVYQRWLQARCGRVRVVVGERRAAFWPVDRLGLAIVLDEANPAHKERRSPRHNVREVLLERARRAGGVGLLVASVPSAAGWTLLRERRLVPVLAGRATETRHAPRIDLDHADGGPNTRLGRRAVPALRHAVADGTYGVVLASRRGEGSALACSTCGARMRCPTCAGSLTGAGRGVLCRTCGYTLAGRRPCEDCGGRQFAPLAAGAERIAEELRPAIPAPVHVLEGYDQPVPPAPAVLVMTRGSVLDAAPGPVGAVVLPDLEVMARRPSVDAPEDALRLAMAVGSWASPDGEVVVKTRSTAAELESSNEPEGAVLRALKRWDPGSFWRDQAPRRAQLGLPPGRQAIAVELRAPDTEVDALMQAVGAATVLGPVAVEGGARRLLILTEDRVATLDALRPLRVAWSKQGLDVRVDVDPVALL